MRFMSWAQRFLLKAISRRVAGPAASSVFSALLCVLVGYFPIQKFLKMC